MTVGPGQQETVQLLNLGEITSLELSPWGSNYTFLVQVRNGSEECRAVYKPRDGEMPLWDFPSGTLYKREYAAYLLSSILGWNFVPTTVIRDGPYGVGSLQLFVEHDPRVNYFSLRESHTDELRMIAAFDLVSNNTDRKAAHCILDPEGTVWAIDHGLTFHAQVKIRTVIWDFSGEPVPAHLLHALSGFREELKSPTGRVLELLRLLDREEAESLVGRVAWVLDAGEYPGVARRSNIRRTHLPPGTSQ